MTKLQTSKSKRVIRRRAASAALFVLESQRQPGALAESGRLRPQGHRHRLPAPRRHRGRRRSRAHLLDQHGRSQPERRLHRARRPRRAESHDDRSARRHVHAQTAPSRQGERQAVLVRSRRDARDARESRWLEHRDPRRYEPRRSPTGAGRHEMVRRHHRRSRARTDLLDAKRSGQGEDSAASFARISKSRRAKPPANRTDIEVLFDELARADRSGTRSQEPAPVLDRPRRSAARQHGQPRPDGCGFQDAAGPGDSVPRT